MAGVITAPASATTWRVGVAGAERRVQGGPWQTIQARERPDDPVAVLSHSLDDAEATRLAARYGCRQWQGMDSSLKFCLLAEGRFDIHARDSSIHEWDIAAGHAILTAAGGRVVIADGSPVIYGRAVFRTPPFVAMGL